MHQWDWTYESTGRAGTVTRMRVVLGFVMALSLAATADAGASGHSGPKRNCAPSTIGMDYKLIGYYLAGCNRDLYNRVVALDQKQTDPGMSSLLSPTLDLPYGGTEIDLETSYPPTKLGRIYARKLCEAALKAIRFYDLRMVTLVEVWARQDAILATRPSGGYPC